jgi:hypothetical protein
MENYVGEDVNFSFDMDKPETAVEETSEEEGTDETGEEPDEQ